MNNLEYLTGMSKWEVLFAKDAVHHAKRLVHIAKQAGKGRSCPAYAEEAAAIAKFLSGNGERVAKWLKALEEARVAEDAKELRCSDESSAGTAS